MQPDTTPASAHPVNTSTPTPSIASSISDQVCSADGQEKTDRIERYSSPEFRRQLLEHMHEAKKAAILESMEEREK
jgi:hypothetical protein